MKIAIVIERFEPWRGGAETSTNEITRLLAERGHDVHVITTSTMPSPPHLTVHQIPAARLLRPLRLGSFIRRTARFLRKNEFDVVHAVAPLPSATVYQPRGGLVAETLARNVATRSSRPRQMLKQALQAVNVKKRALLELEREIFRPDGPTIAAVSQYVADQCRRIYAAEAPRVRVIYNGVHIAEHDRKDAPAHRQSVRRQYHVPDDTMLLLFVGHNFRLKGLAPLIETLSRLVVGGFDRFHLLVVGRDNAVGYWRRIQSLGLQTHVTFTGPTKRTSLFYFAADALVHPTYYDPCSRVVLEALARGLPCITTRYNGASELITDGHDGFVIDTPDDVGLWARRIQELADPELRRRISERALALRPRLSMQRHVEGLCELYEQCRAARRPQGQLAT